MIVVADSSPLHYLILIEQVGPASPVFLEGSDPKGSCSGAQQARDATYRERLVGEGASMADGGFRINGADRRQCDYFAIFELKISYSATHRPFRLRQVTTYLPESRIGAPPPFGVMVSS